MLRSEIEARLNASYKVLADYDKDLIRLHKLKAGIQAQIDSLMDKRDDLAYKIDRLNDQLSELEDT